MIAKASGQYDAIVIGGGHNGLVNAAYLARAGKKVLVLERRHLVGGAAVTEEIIPGFKFSVCSYVVSLLRPEIIRDLDLAASWSRDSSPRRHLHAHAQRRPSLAGERSWPDHSRAAPPLQVRCRGLRRIRQSHASDVPLREADPGDGAARSDHAESEGPDEDCSSWAADFRTSAARTGTTRCS